MNPRSLWPPRPWLVFTVGAAIGLAVWLPLMLLDNRRADPVSPLIIFNAAAFGLILLVVEGPWRRTVASVTLTLAFWLALYSTLTLLYWRGALGHIERMRAGHVQYEEFLTRWQGTLPKLKSPPYRALRRAELEQDLRRAKREFEGTLKDWSELASGQRNAFLLSLGCSVLCVAGATRALPERKRVQGSPEASESDESP